MKFFKRLTFNHLIFIAFISFVIIQLFSLYQIDVLFCSSIHLGSLPYVVLAILFVFFLILFFYYLPVIFVIEGYKVLVQLPIYIIIQPKFQWNEGFVYNYYLSETRRFRTLQVIRC